MTLGESIRSGTRWLAAGNLGNQVLQFAVGIILARLLVPADFGMLVTMQIFTGLAGFVSGAGMGQALVQSKTAEIDDFRVVFTFQLAIGLVIYMFFFLIAPWFAQLYHTPIYADLLRVSALSFILRPFINNPNAYLQREMQFKRQSIVTFICMLFSSIVSLVLALMNMGVWSLVLAGIAGTLLNLVLLYSVTPIRPGFSFSKNAIQRLGAYGFKVTANNLASYINKQMSNFIITTGLGPAMVGLYNKSTSLHSIPGELVSGSAYQTVFRALSKVQDNKDQSQYIYFRTITLVCVYLWPVYILMMWLAEPFIVFVYGPKWVTAALPLQILAVSGLFLPIAHQAGAVVAAQNRLGSELRIHVEYGILVAIACLVGLRWGIAGVAVAMIPCHIFTTVRMFRLATGCIGGNLSDLRIAVRPAFLLSSIMIGVVLVAHQTLVWTHPGLAEEHPGIYLATVGLAGGGGYLLAFFYLPIAALEAEVARWKHSVRSLIFSRA